MATLGSSNLTLADHAKILDPTGKVARVVELLDQMNAVYQDSVWKEGNLPTGHRVVVRKSLPSPSWRRLNQGVSPTKATTEQIDEYCGMLEDWSEVDKDLAELNGEVNAFRLQHARAHLEGIVQEWSSTFFYGNHDTAQEEFTGIAPRYASAASGDTIQNVIDAGGSQSDNTSIYLVGWGDPVYCVYPKGSKAGIFHENLGLQTVETSTGPGGGKMRAYQDHWQLKGGLCVEDWRFIVRIGSIDISSLIADGAGSSVKLMEYMLKAVHRLPRLEGITPAFYMNRTVGEMLDVQAMNKSNLYLMAGNEEGKRKLSFRGIPIRICDAITETESLV